MFIGGYVLSLLYYCLFLHAPLHLPLLTHLICIIFFYFSGYHIIIYCDGDKMFFLFAFTYLFALCIILFLCVLYIINYMSCVFSHYDYDFSYFVS